MLTRAEKAAHIRKAMFNLPNQLTSLRLILSVIMFCFIHHGWYITSMVLFIIAAGTDWLDGYYARKYGQVTTLGRILDPFADKVIVCGTFIFLVAIPELTTGQQPWGLKPWMVVVIVGRELLVTALRSFIEDRGSDFSANMSGKLKMVIQCVAAGTCLFWMHYIKPGDTVIDGPAWCKWLLITSIWASVVLTIYSGLVYIRMAVRLLQSDE
jgi:CDP-diacylglycerol---glycerol-3-phosphate 3-phosphatidyltransferase